MGVIRLFWTRYIYTDEMDSGHTRSISVSTSSQYVLDYHLMWIKTYTARLKASRQWTKCSLLRKKGKKRIIHLVFFIRLTASVDFNNIQLCGIFFSSRIQNNHQSSNNNIYIWVYSLSSMAFVCLLDCYQLHTSHKIKIDPS